MRSLERLYNSKLLGTYTLHRPTHQNGVQFKHHLFCKLLSNQVNCLKYLPFIHRTKTKVTYLIHVLTDKVGPNHEITELRDLRILLLKTFTL